MVQRLSPMGVSHTHLDTGKEVPCQAGGHQENVHCSHHTGGEFVPFETLVYLFCFRPLSLLVICAVGRLLSVLAFGLTQYYALQ